jgi:AraC-like DNA-binding protein
MSQPETRRSPGHARKALGPSEVSRLRAAYAEGIPLEWLAQRFGVSRNKLAELVKEGAGA